MLFIKKIGQSRPTFVYIRLFHSTQFNKDGVLGTRTRGSRMEGADESTELWQRHPKKNAFALKICKVMDFFVIGPSWVGLCFIFVAVECPLAAVFYHKIHCELPSATAPL